MADDFQVCNGNWWTTAARTASLDVPGMASVVSSVSCSTSFTDVGGGAAGFGCKAVSSDEPIGSGSACSSITYQEIHRPHQVSDSMVVGGGVSLMDPGLQLPVFGLSSSSMMDWNQALISRPAFQQDLPIESNQVPVSSGELAVHLFKDMNQGFLQEQHHLSPGNFSVPSACYEYPPTHLYQPSPVAYRPEELPQASWAKYPQLNFSNNTPYWNASAGAAASDVRPTFVSQAFDRKQPSSNSLSIKANSEAVSSGAKKNGSEPAFKKPRMETPSPLPTFKVRKEKLGDRITALQQLVSPFGKTDTASVLHEAIEYIKFLHDQVGVLSTPYLKNGHAMQQQKNSDKPKDGEGPKQDLRSRGLCLVPVSSTYPVASETPADFWTPTFGGTYR